MFCDRLLSIGAPPPVSRASSLRRGRPRRGPDARGARHLIFGLGPNLATILPILQERGVPTVFVGTRRGGQINPGLNVYLHVSDKESLQNRITQFASHIAVQYVLDSLFCCLFAQDYGASFEFLERALPATALPALRGTELSPSEYASVMLNRLR